MKMCKMYKIFSCLIATAVVYADQQYRDVVFVNLYHNNLDFFDSFLSPGKIDGLQYSPENIPPEAIQTLRKAWNSYSSMRGRLLQWCVEVNNTYATNFNLDIDRDDFVIKMIRGINDMKTFFNSISTNDYTPNTNTKTKNPSTVPDRSRGRDDIEVARSEFPTSTSTSLTMQSSQFPVLVPNGDLAAAHLVPLGKTVRITCGATAVYNVPVVISWIKEEIALPPPANFRVDNGNLVITDVELYNSGTYVCNVFDARDTIHPFIVQKIRIAVQENYSQPKTGNAKIRATERQKRQVYGTKNSPKTFEDELEYAKSLIDHASEVIREIYNDENKNISKNVTVMSCKPVLDKLATPPVKPPEYTISPQTVLPSGMENLTVYSSRSCRNEYEYNNQYGKNLCVAFLSKSTMERFKKVYRIENTVADFFNAINSVGSTQECNDRMKSFITNSYTSWAYNVQTMTSTQFLKIYICLRSDESPNVYIVNHF